MILDRCTCPPRPRGPPWDDGAEHGPCAWCEAQAWQIENGLTDEDLEAMIEDNPP